MQIDSLMMNYDNEIYNCNMVKEMVLQRLLKDKVISEEQLQEYLVKWHIVILKQSWFKRLFGDNKEYIFKFVKLED